MVPAALQERLDVRNLQEVLLHSSPGFRQQTETESSFPESLTQTRHRAGGFTWIWFARLAGPRSVSKSPAVRPPPRPSLQVFGDAALQPDHLGPAVVFVGCRVALHVLKRESEEVKRAVSDMLSKVRGGTALSSASTEPFTSDTCAQAEPGLSRCCCYRAHLLLKAG